MGLKIKAIIFGKDRNNRAVILNKKNRKDKRFTYKQNDYMIESEHFVITSGWKWGWKRNYITFYYREGSPMPLPAPDFPDIKITGVSGGELNALFNDVFYRIIAASQDKKKLDYIMYVAIGSLLVSGFTLWQVMNLPDKLLKALGHG